MWPLGELLSTWGAQLHPLYYKFPGQESQNSLRGLKWERKKYLRLPTDINQVHMHLQVEMRLSGGEDESHSPQANGETPLPSAATAGGGGRAEHSGRWDREGLLEGVAAGEEWGGEDVGRGPGCPYVGVQGFKGGPPRP